MLVRTHSLVIKDLESGLKVDKAIFSKFGEYGLGVLEIECEVH